MSLLLGENYLKAIAEVTNKPVTQVIYSHAHIDHIGSAEIFPENATYIAQQETADELQRSKSVAKNPSMVPPIPTVTFAENHTLEIGNQTLQLSYYGNNHTDGNVFIYSPKQKVLMLVDVIFPGWVPFPYLAIAKDVAGFIKVHDIVLNNYDFDTLVGGHLTRLGTRNDVIWPLLPVLLAVWAWVSPKRCCSMIIRWLPTRATSANRKI